MVTRHPRLVFVALIGAALIGGLFGLPYVSSIRLAGGDFDAAGSRSVETAETIERLTHAAPSPTVVALFGTRHSAFSLAGQREAMKVIGPLKAEPGIAGVVSYAESPIVYREALARVVSRDHHSTFVAGVPRAGWQRTGRAVELAESLERRFPRKSGVLLGGSTMLDREIGTRVRDDLERTELWITPILALLLMLVLGRGLPAIAPLLAGAMTVLETFALLRLAGLAGAHVSPLALTAITGLGLGLGIDYSLLFISRLREQVEGQGTSGGSGTAPERRAARTILYSASTVAVSLGSLMVFPVPLLFSIGLGASICALLAGANSLLLLTAASSLWPGRFDRRATRRRLADCSRRGWDWIARVATRRALPVAIVVAAILIGLGTQALGTRFRGVEANVLPADSNARRVADTLAERFPPGASSEVLSLLVHAPSTARDAIEAYENRLIALPRVLEVGGQRILGPDLWEISVASEGPRLSILSRKLVGEVLAGQTPFRVDVASPSASFLDQQAAIANRLPVALALIALSTFAILLCMTGSVLVPIKTLLLSGLTYAATFGLLVLVFQKGLLSGLLGLPSQGPLESTLPVLMFAAVFALSTDYSVFVVSRIQEERAVGVSERTAIRRGLSRSGPVVTSAALLFCVTVLAFATSSVLLVKEVSVGMAVAVALDATLVRALLIPSLMALLGPYNWWAPRPVERLLAAARPSARAHRVSPPPVGAQPRS